MQRVTFLKLSSTLFFAFPLISGCSSMGGGSGEGTFSDQDLAANAAEYNGGNIPLAAEDGLFEDVRFGYDSSEVAPEYRDMITKNAQKLASDSSVHAEIEGHCDKRGTNDYNMALGESRARNVAKMLVSQGVKAEQLSTISYGEEVPIDPADSEDAYAKNRRAHFALYRQK